MSSKFNIINLAYRRLGTDPIAAIGEDTENYRKADDVYDLLRRSLLRAHPWSFAKKEVALTASSSTPVLNDFTYIFHLPADFLRLNKTDVEPGYPHKIKGRSIYSQSSALSIEYGYDCKDPDAWVTTTYYALGTYTLQSNAIYYCLISHSSTTFATNLASGYWVQQDIYDASFTDLLATALAYDLCIPITNSAPLKEIIGAELKTKLNMARSMNALEITPEEGTLNEWLNSRL